MKLTTAMGAYLYCAVTDVGDERTWYYFSSEEEREEVAKLLRECRENKVYKRKNLNFYEYVLCWNELITQKIFIPFDEAGKKYERTMNNIKNLVS